MLSFSEHPRCFFAVIFLILSTFVASSFLVQYPPPLFRNLNLEYGEFDFDVLGAAQHVAHPRGAPPYHRHGEHRHGPQPPQHREHPSHRPYPPNQHGDHPPYPPPPQHMPHHPPPPHGEHWSHHPHMPPHPPSWTSWFWKEAPSRPSPSTSEQLHDAEMEFQETVKLRQGLLEELSQVVDIDTMLFVNKDYTDLLEYLTVPFTCPHNMQKLGNPIDGPKWVCGFERVQEKNECVIYSIGITGKRTVEDIPGCDIFVFDLEELQAASLSGIMQANGHCFVDILMIEASAGGLGAIEKIFGDLEKRPSHGQPPKRPQYPPPRRGYSQHHSPPHHALPIGQMHLTITSGETPGSFGELYSLWQKLEQLGFRSFSSEPRVHTKGYAHMSTEYSFLNIHGDPVLLSDHPDHRHPDQRQK